MISDIAKQFPNVPTSLVQFCQTQNFSDEDAQATFQSFTTNGYYWHDSGSRWGEPQPGAESVTPTPPPAPTPPDPGPIATPTDEAPVVEAQAVEAPAPAETFPDPTPHTSWYPGPAVEGQPGA